MVAVDGASFAGVAIAVGIGGTSVFAGVANRKKSCWRPMQVLRTKVEGGGKKCWASSSGVPALTSPLGAQRARRLLSLTHAVSLSRLPMSAAVK
jgi:hypothetical protein